MNGMLLATIITCTSIYGLESLYRCISIMHRQVNCGKGTAILINSCHKSQSVHFYQLPVHFSSQCLLVARAQPTESQSNAIQLPNEAETPHEHIKHHDRHEAHIHLFTKVEKQTVDSHDRLKLRSKTQEKKIILFAFSQLTTDDAQIFGK